MVSSAEEGSFSAEPFLVEPCLAELCLATVATIQECYLDDLFPSSLNSFYQFMLSLLHAAKKIVEQSDLRFRSPQIYHKFLFLLIDNIMS